MDVLLLIFCVLLGWFIAFMVGRAAAFTEDKRLRIKPPKSDTGTAPPVP